MKRTIYGALIVLLFSLALHAEAVFLSSNGKTYHKTDHCMALARSHKILSAERETAEAHHLRPCGICYRAKKAGAAKGAANSWAQAITTPNKS
jgi:hypothetical protein